MPTTPTEIAPDGSTITPLARNDHASICLCTLEAGAVSKPVRHRSVEEFWYIVEGSGELYLGSQSQRIALLPGQHVTIPTGDVFQFRNQGNQPLKIVITTTPPWPGEHEAEPVASGAWERNSPV